MHGQQRQALMQGVLACAIAWLLHSQPTASPTAQNPPAEMTCCRCTGNEATPAQPAPDELPAELPVQAF